MKIILLSILVCISTIFSQNKIELFPDDLLVQPFTANQLEPKLGFLFQIGNNELRLDIGNSLDLVRMDVSESESFSFGADLFTYTLLRGESDFHFPVDAVDYLFGLNAGYLKTEENISYGARFRLSHISAHFVDGHFDHQSQQWRDGQAPRVYSREFLELMPFVKFNGVRLYVGLTYLIHVTPTEIGKDIYQLGFDYFADGLISENIIPFIGYDFKLVNIDSYTGNNSINLGIKFGTAEGKGLSIYYNFYSGKSIHGEYFDFYKEYSAIGVNLDL